MLFLWSSSAVKLLSCACTQCVTVLWHVILVTVKGDKGKNRGNAHFSDPYSFSRPGVASWLFRAQGSHCWSIDVCQGGPDHSTDEHILWLHCDQGRWKKGHQRVVRTQMQVLNKHWLWLKARGKSGPLFSFDVHDDVRLLSDATVEKDESHAGESWLLLGSDEKSLVDNYRVFFRQGSAAQLVWEEQAHLSRISLGAVRPHQELREVHSGRQEVAEVHEVSVQKGKHCNCVSYR